MTAWAGFFHGRGQPDMDRAILLRMHGVRLELASGEIHGLLGANGSGKSSLAHAVMGCEAYRPSAGDHAALCTRLPWGAAYITQIYKEVVDVLEDSGGG